MRCSCTIMVVEDETLIALDLAMTLEEMGAAVVGPFGTLRGALAGARDVDAAILDVDLGGQTVFPLADRLSASGTAILFHTARTDTAALRDRYGPDVPILSKPARFNDLSHALLRLVDTARGRGRRDVELRAVS